jgi:hypothetical protein
MEGTMIHRSLPYDPTPEDRLTRTKWARRVGIFYSCALLLLLAFATTHRMLIEPKGPAGVAAAQVHAHVASDPDGALPTASISPIGERGSKTGHVASQPRMERP